MFPDRHLENTYFALGNVGTHRPSSHLVLQPQWSTGRDVTTTSPTAPGDPPPSAFPSPEKLLDGVACAGIFSGKTNGDSDPLIERWKRPRDLDTFSNQLRRDHFVRLSGLEEYEISPGIRAAAPERVEQRVPLLSLFFYFQSHSVHVAGVTQAGSSGRHREPVEAVRGANAVAFRGSGKPFRCDRVAYRHSGQPVDLSEGPEHHDIGATARQLHGGLLREIRFEFEVGLIDDDGCPLRRIT